MKEAARCGWGPNSRLAAVSLTFDNLGEAADLEFGTWPPNEPVGQHYTTTRVVPALLEALGTVKATFFVEAWNCEIYPELLKGIHAQGHEVGVHGWRHELWHKVPLEARSGLLARCKEAFARIGIRPLGFRPPGGQSTEDLSELLRGHGFTYHSSVGERATVRLGVAELPFKWTHIDGYHLEPEMKGSATPGENPVSAHARLRRALDEGLEEAVHRQSHLMLIFHPWIVGKDLNRLQLVAELAQSLRERDDVWVARAADVAAQLREQAA